MKPPAIRKAPTVCPSRPDERGVTMVLVALAMVAIISMAALSIDVITLYLAREEAQRSADAAALAAARVISVSGMTGDPDNAATRTAICGGVGSPATLAAIAVGTQSSVGGSVASSTSVTYSVGATKLTDCSGLPAAFGVNPVVNVLVTRNSLPTFFSRIWGNTGNSVSANATAEAFNPSNSGSVAATIIPVQPSCVKPWIVPNQDPLNPDHPGNSGNYCNMKGKSCAPLVVLADGSIQNKGITLNGNNFKSTGVIGETFWLVPDCAYSGSNCTLLSTPSPGQPLANFSGTTPPLFPSLQYVPGQTIYTPTAVPSCASVGSGGSPDYEPSIGGCDQSTLYQCGVQNTPGNAPMVDLSENPRADTTNGVKCLINEGDPTASQPDGQDTFDNYAAPSTYPFQVLTGSSSPLGLASGSPITSSNSIVSLPIYDEKLTTLGTGTTSVTIVGFLQVFINAVDQNGDISVTILNVSGCGNGSGGTVGPSPVTGTSPVPIRLITPP
ncbi:MAG: hypothetical protein DMG79_16940 [Acidobacteria bacterium]|nr:MAG: hypothetical protein DMG79_16940 [Acidobacteriota bacterium]